jgi:hypothetical protein
MDVGLGNIPQTVGFRQFGILGGIVADRDGLCHQFCADHMMGMAIFSGKVVGYRNLWLESPQLFYYETQQLIPAEIVGTVKIVGILNVTALRFKLLGIAEYIIRKITKTG